MTLDLSAPSVRVPIPLGRPDPLDYEYGFPALAEAVVLTCEAKACHWLAYYLAFLDPARKPPPAHKATFQTQRQPSGAKYRVYLAQECTRAGVSYEAALSLDRQRPLCVARWKAWKRLRVEGASFPGIGRVACVDHTSAVHGLRRLGAIESIGQFVRMLAP